MRFTFITRWTLGSLPALVNWNHAPSLFSAVHSVQFAVPDIGFIHAECGGTWSCSVDARHGVVDGDPGHLEEPTVQRVVSQLSGLGVCLVRFAGKS